MRSLIAIALLGTCMAAFAAAERYKEYQEYEKHEEYDTHEQTGKHADEYEDLYGYEEGYDKHGQYQEGYQRGGYNTKRYHKHGHGKEGHGYDRYDKHGYDKHGHNKDSYHRDEHYKHGSCSAHSPAPLATLLGNPPGKWNNFGNPQLPPINQDCIPFLKFVTDAAGNPDITDPRFINHILATGSPPPGALYETTILLNLLSTNIMTLWTALAQYTDTMQPFWPVPGVTKQPDAKRTVENKNIAMLYASNTFWNNVLPNPVWQAAWPPLFRNVSLDPYDTSMDPTTAVGIGNLVGAAALKQLASTNWNVQGNIGYTVYQRPYADQTGFVPSNTAYELKHPLKWQPLLETAGLGYFQVQSHVTPQAACVEATLADKTYISTAKSPAPYEDFDPEEYKANADFILELSAGLTDAQKMSAEYFAAISLTKNWAPDQQLLGGLGADTCFVDASALVWREKLRHQAVRPISAIRDIYKDSNVTAWLQNKGSQTYPGREWTSYLRTMPHADYPSFTACVCAVYGSYYREMTGTNKFPLGPIEFQAGCSKREPGLTPAQDVIVTYTTWDQFVDGCAQTRAYAGVHFQAAIDEAKRLCAPIGKQCYKTAYKLRYGPDSTPGPVQ